MATDRYDKEIITIPWSFSIEFDPERTEKNGYDLDTLYEYVDKNVSLLGLKRIAYRSWKAKFGEEVESQCLALSVLTRQKWVMQNIESLVFYEDGLEANDCLEITKKRNPDRILV